MRVCLGWTGPIGVSLGSLRILAATRSFGAATLLVLSSTCRLIPTAAVWHPTPARPAIVGLHVPSSKPRSILVLGTDERPDEDGWRTDTVLFMPTDSQKQQIGLLSIPRDQYVDLPEGGRSHINTLDYVGETNGYPGGGQDCSVGCCGTHRASVPSTTLSGD